MIHIVLVYSIFHIHWKGNILISSHNQWLVEKSVELAASVAAFQQTPPSLPSRERQQQDLG